VDGFVVPVLPDGVQDDAGQGQAQHGHEDDSLD
jgi:hypothetical protein